MKLTDLFIRRPVLAIVVNLVILIAGLQAIRSLSVRQYPRSDIAVVTVSTVYVGANADLVRGFITTPLERVIASADGIDYIESSSAQGVSTITVHLKLNYDTNAALTQIQAKVAQVRNDLPPEAQAPVIDLQTADTQFAAMYLGFSSSELDQNQITDYLTRVVQPKLSAISGVQRADILGSRTFAMRIRLKAEKMGAVGSSRSHVRDGLANNNYLAALGKTKGSMVSVNLVANTNLQTAEDFRRLVVKEDKGVIVRLGEIADVVLGAENYESDVRFNGQSATFMGIWVLPTANSLDVIRKGRQAMPDIDEGLPTGMKVGIPYDSTEYIQDAINEVLRTLTETLLIVIVVIFLFLGSVRAVIIPLVAIPISLIGAVFLMLLAGFTINLLTLLAIVLSVGLVVDDAIVMVENVERHLHLGKSPFQAAKDAARELVGPIIAMTITLAAVYAPIGIQGGLTGALFREFAFTLAGAVIISGVVALTLSPMMSSKLLRAGVSDRGFAGMINRQFEVVRSTYARLLTGTLNYRPVVFALWAIVALLIVPFYMFSQKELAPKEDQSVVFGLIQAAPNATLDQTKLFSSQVHDVYRSFPEAESIFQITAPNGGFGGMVTKPWSQRKKTTEQLQVEAAGKLSTIPGGFRRRLDGGAGAADRVRQPAGRKGVRQRSLHVRRLRPEVRSAAGRGRVRPRQAPLPGRGPLPGGPRPLDDARRRLRQPLQHPGAQLQGHPPGQARGAPDAGPARADLRYRRRRKAGSAFDLRDAQEHHRASGVEAVSAVERGAHPGRHPAGRLARQSAQGPRGRGLPQPAERLHRRLCRRIAPASGRRGEVPRDVPAVGNPDLPRARRPVRELPGPVHHPGGLGPARSLGRAALLVPRPDEPEHLQPGRPDHARRPRVEERDPDRRVRQQSPGAGKRQVPRRHRGGRHAITPDPHDDGRDGHGTFPARLRYRPGSRRPQLDRHDARDRHDHRLGLHSLRRALDLRAGGEDPQGRRVREGARTGGRGPGSGAGGVRREVVMNSSELRILLQTTTPANHDDWSINSFSLLPRKLEPFPAQAPALTCTATTRKLSGAGTAAALPDFDTTDFSS